MMQLPDAPWIKAAETYGYPVGGYEWDDEEEEDDAWFAPCYPNWL